MICLLLGVVFGCFLWASVMDYRTCRVYNFLWWIAGSAVLLILLLSQADAGTTAKGLWACMFDGDLWMKLLRLPGFVDMLLFWLLQLKLFSRMYGRADCYAFGVSGMLIFTLGYGLKLCLVHMLFAIGLLGVVQAFRRNIGKDGNLKHPVAFVPYISFSLWILLVPLSSFWYDVSVS